MNIKPVLFGNNTNQFNVVIKHLKKGGNKKPMEKSNPEITCAVTIFFVTICYSNVIFSPPEFAYPASATMTTPWCMAWCGIAVNFITCQRVKGVRITCGTQ